MVLTPDGGAEEIYIDGASGAIIEQNATRTPALAVAGAPAITAQQAIDVALGAVAAGTVLEANLDMEATRLVCGILVRCAGGRTEFYVDASGGELLKVEDA